MMHTYSLYGVYVSHFKQYPRFWSECALDSLPGESGGDMIRGPWQLQEDEWIIVVERLGCSIHEVDLGRGNLILGFHQQLGLILYSESSHLHLFKDLPDEGQRGEANGKVERTGAEGAETSEFWCTAYATIQNIRPTVIYHWSCPWHMTPTRRQRVSFPSLAVVFQVCPQGLGFLVSTRFCSERGPAQRDTHREMRKDARRTETMSSGPSSVPALFVQDRNLKIIQLPGPHAI